MRRTTVGVRGTTVRGNFKHIFSWVVNSRFLKIPILRVHFDVDKKIGNMFIIIFFNVKIQYFYVLVDFKVVHKGRLHDWRLLD